MAIGQEYDAQEHGLYLDVSADGFLCDAEYFLPRTKGYTYVGSRLQPSLRYLVNSQVQLHGGVRLTALAGKEGLWHVEPVLTFDFAPATWVHILMGTLHGDSLHLLGAPMQDPNRWYYDYTQEGLQILTHTAHWESDTWLDWEHFLEPWSADQERFTLGTRQEFYLFDHQHPEQHHWQVSLPVAFTGSHRGGQVSSLDTCIETLFNEEVGLRADWRGTSTSFGITLPLYLYQNGSPRGERYRPWDDGWGIWPTAHVCTSWKHSMVEAEVGYWRSSQFISSHGHPLFMSISDYNPIYLQRDIHLATVSLLYTLRQHDFNLALSLNGYYDTDLHKLDFSLGLVMRFAHSFQLCK